MFWTIAALEQAIVVSPATSRAERLHVQVVITNRSCSLCQGRGILQPATLCPRCEGAGRVPKIGLLLPIIAQADALAFDGLWWSQLVVIRAVHTAGRTIASGVTESGRHVTTALRPGALAAAPRVLFERKELS